MQSAPSRPPATRFSDISPAVGVLRFVSCRALTLVKPDENLQACFAKSHLFTPLDYLDTITVLLLDKVVAFPAHKMLSIETLKVRYCP